MKDMVLVVCGMCILDVFVGAGHRFSFWSYVGVSYYSFLRQGAYTDSDGIYIFDSICYLFNIGIFPGNTDSCVDFYRDYYQSSFIVEGYNLRVWGGSGWGFAMRCKGVSSVEGDYDSLNVQVDINRDSIGQDMWILINGQYLLYTGNGQSDQEVYVLIPEGYWYDCSEKCIPWFETIVKVSIKDSVVVLEEISPYSYPYIINCKNYFMNMLSDKVLACRCNSLLQDSCILTCLKDSFPALLWHGVLFYFWSYMNSCSIEKFGRLVHFTDSFLRNEHDLREAIWVLYAILARTCGRK